MRRTLWSAHNDLQRPDLLKNSHVYKVGRRQLLRVTRPSQCSANRDEPETVLADDGQGLQEKATRTILSEAEALDQLAVRL